MHKAIILIGPPRSGKSTLGPALAQALGSVWRDSDALIEAELGLNPSEILQSYGQSRFREIEALWLQAWQPSSATVLSTGGGLPCFGTNIKGLNKLGHTLYLKWPHAVILERLQTPAHALTQIYSPTELAQLLKQREDFYLQAQTVLEFQSEMDQSESLRLIQEAVNFSG